MDIINLLDILLYPFCVLISIMTVIYKKGVRNRGGSRVFHDSSFSHLLLVSFLSIFLYVKFHWKLTIVDPNYNIFDGEN